MSKEPYSNHAHKISPNTSAKELTSILLSEGFTAKESTGRGHIIYRHIHTGKTIKIDNNLTAKIGDNISSKVRAALREIEQYYRREREGKVRLPYTENAASTHTGMPAKDLAKILRDAGFTVKRRTKKEDIYVHLQTDVQVHVLRSAGAGVLRSTEKEAKKALADVEFYNTGSPPPPPRKHGQPRVHERYADIPFEEDSPDNPDRPGRNGPKSRRSR